MAERKVGSNSRARVGRKEASCETEGPKQRSVCKQRRGPILLQGGGARVDVHTARVRNSYDIYDMCDMYDTGAFHTRAWWSAQRSCRMSSTRPFLTRSTQRSTPTGPSTHGKYTCPVFIICIQDLHVHQRLCVKIASCANCNHLRTFHRFTTTARMGSFDTACWC